MSEWIRIRVKDFYKDAVGELEYTYVTREVYEALADKMCIRDRSGRGRDCDSAFQFTG